jgi:hypothetical protein
MIDEQDDDVAQEIDDTPSWVREGTEDDDFEVEGEDISKAEQMTGGGDVIDPVKDVELIITQIKVDPYIPEGQEEWKTARMEVWMKVGPKGVDGKGKYANKHFFPRIQFAVNRAAEAAGVYDFSVNAQGKKTDYYLPEGGFFGDYNAFLIGLGFKTDPAPKNDAAFRKSLIGKSIFADINKDRKQVKNKSTGKYERVNEYENVLVYKPKKASKPETQVEAAAS